MSTKPANVTTDSMTKEARKTAILRFLRDTDLALPPKAVYINMRREGATFSRRTLNRHLKEMVEEGKVRRLDDPHTYHVITDAGREYLADNTDTAN